MAGSCEIDGVVVVGRALRSGRGQGIDDVGRLDGDGEMEIDAGWVWIGGGVGALSLVKRGRAELGTAWVLGGVDEERAMSTGSMAGHGGGGSVEDGLLVSGLIAEGTEKKEETENDEDRLIDYLK
ncbi:hypothetical protein M0R45_002329 [Rubus argutus]|uniref:Uncharacterized protein n=1 Tax=Rubus argutus TaxID=59490 RepID=A0AAW1VJN7_RUBAR